MKKDKQATNRASNKSNNNNLAKNTNSKQNNKSVKSNNIGFDNEDHSFELDRDNSKSFELE